MHHAISTRIEGLPDNIQAFPIRHKTSRRNRQKDVLCKIVPCLTHSSMTRVVAILHFTTIILGLIKLDIMEPILLPGFRSRYSEAFLFIALFLTTVKLEVQLRHRLPPSLERSGKDGGRRWKLGFGSSGNTK